MELLLLFFIFKIKNVYILLVSPSPNWRRASWWFGMVSLFPEAPFFLSHILSFFFLLPPFWGKEGSFPYLCLKPASVWLGCWPQQRYEGYRAGDGCFGPERTGVTIAVFGLCLELGVFATIISAPPPGIWICVCFLIDMPVVTSFWDARLVR